MFNKRVTVEDLRTFWKGCIAIYQKRPVFVIGIAQERDGFTATVKDLRTGSGRLLLSNLTP